MHQRISSFIPDNDGGKLNSIMERWLAPGSDFARAANVMFNPGHGDNLMNARPLPDGPAGPVYMHKSMLRGRIILPKAAGATAFRIIATPFVEIPFCLDFGPAGINPIAIFDTNMGTSNGLNIDPALWMHKNGVYSHRCIGKSITVENVTSEDHKSGSIISCQFPASTDIPSPSVTYSAALTATTNERFMQGIPATSDYCANFLKGTNWNIKEGAYMVSKFTDLHFRKRELPWEKCSNLLPDVPATTTTVDNVKITDSSASIRYVQAPTASGYADTNTYTYPMTLTQRARAVFDNTMGGVVFAEGCSTGDADAVFTYKIAICREMMLKPSSPLCKFAEQRPPLNQVFMQQLTNFANQMDDCYPASYNFWNKVWEGFKRAVKIGSGAIPMIAPMLSSFGPEGIIAGKALSAVNGTLSPFIKKW